MTASPPSPSGVAMAAMVSSNMAWARRSVPADAARDLGLAIFEPEPGLLETLALDDMDQLRIGIGGEFHAELVNAREERHQINRRFRRGHAFDRAIKIEQ